MREDVLLTLILAVGLAQLLLLIALIANLRGTNVNLNSLCIRMESLNNTVEDIEDDVDTLGEIQGEMVNHTDDIVDQLGSFLYASRTAKASISIQDLQDPADSENVNFHIPTFGEYIEACGYTFNSEGKLVAKSDASDISDSEE